MLENMIVCGRVGEDFFLDKYAPAHGSVQCPCCRCKAALWLSAEGQTKTGFAPICAECVAVAMQEGPYFFLPPSERMMQEVQDMLREKAQVN